MAALTATSLRGFADQAVAAQDGAGRTWRWFIGEDEDGDGFTTPSHAAVSDGVIQYFHWSRFGRFDAGHFRMFVELGFPNCPARNGMTAPWAPDELAQYYAEQQREKAA